jgi:ABC-2 type transport system permease protein
MKKILAIAWADLYSSFSDRNFVLILIAAPLAIATLIGLAFGNTSGGDVPIRDIPVAVVNLDKGTDQQNYGDIFVAAFVPPAEGAEETATGQPTCPTADAAETDETNNQNLLYDLTDATRVDDVETARAGVNDGTYTAAIIIPEDFSARIGYGGPTDPVEQAEVEVYANSGNVVSASIIRSIVESIGNQIATGNIAIASTLGTIQNNYGLMVLGQVASGENFASSIACAFASTASGLTIEQQTVTGQQTNNTVAILVLFGSAQAMFFSLFLGQGGVLSLFEEKKQGTLQRLIVSPTPRLFILGGKLFGTFVMCFFQLVVLFLALTVIASLMTGQVMFIWGNNILLLLLMIIATSLMSTGLGTFLAGIAKTPEQSSVYAQLINIAFVLIGGGFGFQLPEAIARFSPIYWGTNAFQKLAAGQTDIALNFVVLLAFGVILFAVGYGMFVRRLDI